MVTAIDFQFELNVRDMSETGREPRIERSGLEDLITAARDAAPVSGLTHNFYRYPARFSPVFVRAVILALSEPGDWVMDPFAGGGTTLVEALAAGRNVLGIDVSGLAAFVCEAKTLVLDCGDAEALWRWARRLPKAINMHAHGHHFADYADAGYYRNIGGRDYWRLRKAIEQALASASSYVAKAQRQLPAASCSGLRSGRSTHGRPSRPCLIFARNSSRRQRR